MVLNSGAGRAAASESYKIGSFSAAFYRVSDMNAPFRNLKDACSEAKKKTEANLKLECSQVGGTPKEFSNYVLTPEVALDEGAVGECKVGATLTCEAAL